MQRQNSATQDKNRMILKIATHNDSATERALGNASVFVALGTGYPLAQRCESLCVLQT